MRELNPRAWIPSFNRYATGFDNLYYHRQMNGVGEWWCYTAGEDEQLDVEIELSTGLKDKYGEEIYEGDIVSERNGDIIGEIVQKPSGEYRIAWLGVYCSDSSLYDHRSLCEVIGNIHENPGLLVEVNDVD